MMPHQPYAIDTNVADLETPPSTGSGSTRSRKRQRDGDSGSRSREAAKKKKANRACFHCQKAHLTCDDSRPCQRCVKRGMADSCVEGIRKKAKYLLDEEELAELKKQKDVKGPEASGSGSHVQGDPYMAPNDPLNNLVLNTKHPFDSQAVNMEYSIMSAILGPGAQEPAEQQQAAWPATATAAYMPFTPQDVGSTPSYGTPGDPGSAAFSGASMAFATPFSAASGESQPTPPQARPQTPPPQPQAEKQPESSPSKTRQSAVYRSVTKPYDYREGFHFLMRHLKERYVKNDILRIIRAIAMLRPSLIALQVPLSEEDEVFVEKCFQRSVLELEKLISFNGTPTVVWRRTGEICVVGVEFSVLTGWSRDELLGQRKYIYELFENQSAVEYWEQFATHAFENTLQSVHTHCVLLTKTGVPVLCAFCFSIRRDIFDLPDRKSVV